MTENRQPPVVDFMPVPDITHDCPVCDHALDADDWHMPGMRPLAVSLCANCDHKFFADLPSGNAVHTPTLLDCDTGETYQPTGESYWFAKWLRESYDEQTDAPVDVTVEGMETVANPAVLNCLDALYGHALLKMLTVQRFIEKSARDVVVICQPNLRWLVPDDATAVVTVELPLGRGHDWNETLAAKFSDIFADYGNVALCSVDPHPHRRRSISSATPASNRSILTARGLTRPRSHLSGG